jgi:hypothetical protein
MTVKELKKTLAGLSSDFDDTPVLVQHLETDGIHTSLEAVKYSGYTKGFESVLLGTQKAYEFLKEKGVFPEENKKT